MRVFECVSVDSLKRGPVTDVKVRMPGDEPAVELTLGEGDEYEYDIAFVTEHGRTVVIIRSGNGQH